MLFIFEDDVQDHKRETGHTEFFKSDFDSTFNRDAVNSLKLSMHQAIISALSSLGERTMNSIIWYLKSSGVMIDSTNIDVRVFYLKLEEIIGPTADTIFESIIRQLSIHYKIERGVELSEADLDLPVTLRLQNLMRSILNSRGGV